MRGKARVGTRLLVLLLPTVAIVMTVFAAYALSQRESVMTSEARRETQAYALAMALALENASRDVRREGIQEIMDELSREATVYGILVYDSVGERVLASTPLTMPSSAEAEDLRQVLSSGVEATLERAIGAQRVFSVLRPIRNRAGRTVGVLEVAQPLAHIEAEKSRVRRRFMLNTLTLVLALTMATLWLVRRTISAPMEEMVGAVRAFGSGELSRRLRHDAGAEELSTLAHEFNRMADGLETAREAISREVEERLALERRLRESEKMAAIGTLAAGVAHEIAAPLNVIAGRAEMLRAREQQPEVRERYLRIIHEQTGRITTIVRNLLDFARRREAHPVPTDLDHVVGGVLEFLETELQRAGVRVERGGESGLEVEADPDLLHQVMVNVLLNAAQAMESSGEEDRRLALHVSSSSERAERLVVLRVTDTGPGVPAELAERIFSPFFTTRPGGTGLGLALARNMMEEQGGRIEIEKGSERGRGATFRITMRRSTAAGGADA